ncbi:Protein of unknown function [Pseudoxanthobacter soli DSM 19599]|uniref:Lipopolysaccharide assembly protein A domain-containing protein n=1 Tax=Pseudoxanthobacter soli DSM 19599 TaxID=1123029 RepID=A0A1M7ZMN0_9HYPH|nr:lipopolysaccharide assembly protein LapA domain-containing protein [Pseudoxanthobacter soli]SHO66072.1 Protein of unknown function [Pseudoxanthobacter soli DSM 19599]
MRFLKALVLIVLAVALVAVAVANRQVVLVSLDPFNSVAPAVAFQIPLYWALFAVLALGVVIGSVGMWFRGLSDRRSLRRERREAGHWRREAERNRARAEAGTGPALPSPASRAG